MISWIQRSFQQHFRIIFGVLLAVTIVSFIITIGAAPGIGQGEHTAQENFYGHNLASQIVMQSLDAQANLSIELLYGYNPADQDQTTLYGEQRLAALALADQLHLPTPAPGSSAVRDYIRTLRAFAGPDGRFDPERYDKFRANLANSGLGDADIARVLVDDVRIARLRKLIAGPGFILPSDVKSALRDSDTLWTVATADVDYASFHPDIKPTPAELAEYFRDNQFRYEIPPRVSAGYVLFPAAAYLGRVHLTDAEIRSYYERDPAHFPKPAAPAGAKAPSVKNPNPDADFDAVRPKVEAALRLERAKAATAKAASDFAFGLYQNKVAGGAPLRAYLAAQHLTEEPLKPFTEAEGPAELGGSQEISQAAFELNADRYYSDAITTPRGAVVVLWQGMLPAREPSFTEVRAKVTSDYIESARRRMFIGLGQSLRTQIARALKAGRTFEQAADAAADDDHVKIKARSWPAFTMRDSPKDFAETALSTLQHLKPGQISPMAVSSDQGYLVYALGEKAPDLSESNPRYAQIRGELAASFATRTANEYLSQLTDNELARAKGAVP
ncbi:MAG: peptidyl-prolyl cis-trans isomerase [Opitutaceae bacterium]